MAREPPAASARPGARGLVVNADRAGGIRPAASTPWQDGLRRAGALAHLGSIASLLFLLLAGSGLYLYVFYDTSVAGAHASVAGLSQQQAWLGGWLRSLHRYGADAFVLVSVLHLLREALLGRFRGFRAATWLTGVPLLALMYLSGIGGMWLPWDELAQYSAVASFELLDALPLIAATLSRNLLHPDALDDRLFSLLVFVHIGMALMMVIGLWFHLQRITRPQLLPPRRLAWTLVALLAGLALLLPVHSLAPADLAREPAELALDWFLLHLHPLSALIGPGATWALIASVLLGLALLPLLPSWQPVRGPVAVVDAANCNGCQRCVHDCPYTAIALVPHPDGKPGRQLAVVDADRCAACGICAGACPSATPFRSISELVTGIDLPEQPIGALRAELQQRLAAGQGRIHTVVYACAHGADTRAIEAPDLACFPLLCAGLLPPSFVEYALRGGARAVVVASCSEHACVYRLGARITAERLAGERPPRLRASVPRDHLLYVKADAGSEYLLSEAIAQARRLDSPETTE